MNHRISSFAVGIAFALALFPAAPPAGAERLPSGANLSGPAAARQHLERGLRYRDKAEELEKEAKAASGAAADKLQDKAKKEFEKAIRAYRTAIRAHEAMYQAHGSLGYALRKTGDYAAALESYNRALQLQPDYTEAIEYRAEAYLALNRLEEVKEAYMNLFRTNREHASVLMGAMRSWVETRRSQPRGLDTTRIEEFASWVEERAGVSTQAALGAGASGSAWKKSGSE